MLENIINCRIVFVPLFLLAFVFLQTLIKI